MTFPTPLNYHTTRIVTDIETGALLDWAFEFNDGEWALLKKGRGEQEQVAKDSLARSKSDEATRNQQLAAADPTLKQFESVGPGGMGTAAQARYQSDLNNINRTYNNVRAVGLRNLGLRGLGNAPNGAESSLVNTANLDQAGQENNAYLGGLQQTREDQLAALNARMGLMNIYNPNASSSVASEAAYRRGQMGSTLGDIGGGLTTLAGLATVPLTAMGVGGYGSSGRRT